MAPYRTPPSALSYCRCQSCPLSSGGEPNDCVLGYAASDDIEYVIVGEAPGGTEVSQGTPFVGRSGQLLRRALTLAGIDVERCYFTNACLCRPYANATPPTSAIQACRKRLGAELRAVNGPKILLTGATALQTFTGDYRAKITQQRGLAWYHPTLDANVVATLHPAMILRAPDAFQALGSDIEKLASLPNHPVRPLDVPAYRTITDARAVLRGVRRLVGTGGWVAIDVETTGLHPWKHKVLALGIAFHLVDGSSGCWVIPGTLLSHPTVRAALQTLFDAENVATVGHNAKFDAEFILAATGLTWSYRFDTMLASYALNEQGGYHDLKQLGRVYFNIPDYTDGIKDEFRQQRAQSIPPDRLYRYLSYDCWITIQLAQILYAQLEREGLWPLVEDLLLPASWALRDIEYGGAPIDEQYLQELREHYDIVVGDALAKLQRCSYTIMGRADFNPRSSKQAITLLELAGAAEHRSTVDRNLQRSTNSKVLESIIKSPGANAQLVEVCQLLLEYRQQAKMRSTYVEGLRQRSVSGRVVPTFKLHGTVTGRLSCSNPNLQNVPKLVGPVIRRVFTADPGWYIVEADYSQLELRVAAFLSGDDVLAQAFIEGRDIHAEVASSALYHIPIEQVTDNHRFFAKMVSFGILYGRSPASLAEQLGCSDSDASRFIQQFFRRYPKLARWRKQMMTQVVKTQELTTIFGRHRRFPLITSLNKNHVQRQAINTPVQSTASDICLSSLIKLHRDLNASIARIIFTVHDSILLEVKQDHILPVVTQVRHVMEHPDVESPVPFIVNIKVGQRWGDAEDWEKFRHTL